MQGTAARVLWTKQVRKKSKTYNDGFLLVTTSGQATLYDENGKELSTATSTSKLPYGLAADPASAEDLSVFEGYLVQGDSACDPAEIYAARGCSPDDSSLSTSTHHASTRAMQQPVRTPAGFPQRQGCAGMGRTAAAPGPARAPLLGRKLSRPAASTAAHAGAAAQAGGFKAPAPAPAGQNFIAQQQQHHHQQQQPDGLGGRLHPNLGPAAVAGLQAVGTSCAPTLQSDDDILQLLESIAPAGFDPLGSTCQQQQQPQQQQQQQYTARPLPAVPQFGRSQQRKQPQQQPAGISMPNHQVTPTAGGQQVQQHQQHQQQVYQIGQQRQWQQTGQQQWQSGQQMQQQQRMQQQDLLECDDFEDLLQANSEPAPAQHQSRWQQQVKPRPGPQQWQQPTHAQPWQQQAQQPQDAMQQQQQDARQPQQRPLQQDDDEAADDDWAVMLLRPAAVHAAPEAAIGENAAGVEARAAAGAGAALKSARDAWAAPRSSAANSSNLLARPVLQPKQPAPQQQQQPQHLQQQQQARMTWQQQQQPLQGADRLGHGSNGPAVAALGKPLQRRAGFNLPRPMAPPAGTSSAAGELPLRAPGLQQQQPQQQGAAGGGQGYCVPGPAAGGPVRRVEVPTSFSTGQQYVSTLTAALTEEVNLQLAEQAKTFYSTVAQVQSVAVTASAGTGQGSYQQDRQQQQQKGSYHQKQQQGSRQQAGSDTASRLQAACARAGLHYHPGASLTYYNNSSSNSYGGGRGGGGWGRGKKRGRGQGGRGGGGDDADEDEDGDAPPRKASSMYLTLSGQLDRRQFRKHDLWLLSNHPLLKASAATGSGPHDRLSQPWVVLARSCWHGPDRDGKMEVELLPGQQQQLPPQHKWQRQQSLTALQGPDVATELQMAAFIGSTDTRQWTLLASFMRPWQVQAAAGVAAGEPAVAVSAAGDAAAGTAGVADGPRQERVDGCGSPGGSLGRLCGGGSSPADSSSSQELPAVCRRKRKKQQSASSSSSDDDAGDPCSSGDGAASVKAPKAAAAAAAGSDSSDWEDNFEPVAASKPGKRARLAAAAAAGGVASAGASLSSDSEEPGDLGGAEDDTTAGAAAAGAPAGPGSAQDVAAAAQKLLAQVVHRFLLNPAQAAVAAHVADWLPQLMQGVQQRQQQGGKIRGACKFKGPVLTARNKAAAVGSSAAAEAAGTGRDAGVSSSTSSGGSRSPVCLIHGPFGSGKSTLLVALIHLLTGLAEQQAQGTKTSKQRQQALTPRILVAAHTNVAVDRVLLGLQEAGFRNMLRMGSLARIAKQLLGVSLHSADDSRDALSQLNSMLPNAAGAEEQMIRSEIAALQAGAERRRRKALSTTAVVGITCCSALQSTLEGQVFDVVLLDEASQMTEPTSLVPLLRAMPSYLIAAGDPCQLPPVLASPTGVTPAAAAQAPGSNPAAGQLQQPGYVAYGLLRPLFVRLTHLGHEPHLLTHQYRCHPMLSLLSNKHFYNRRLVDGVTPAQRSALLPGLPPLVMCDCHGGASQAAGGGSRSSINKAEANLVAQLVLKLLQAPAPNSRVEGRSQQHEDDEDMDEGGECSDAAPRALAAHQLGVVCFFRGQAALIKQTIAADSSCPSAADVQVATVDSFQGAEKEVIILATTTTNPRSEFCSDGARLNVALTRARRHLVVVGAADVLAQAPSAVLRELVAVSKNAQQEGTAYMPGGSLLQLLTQAQKKL